MSFNSSIFHVFEGEINTTISIYIEVEDQLAAPPRFEDVIHNEHISEGRIEKGVFKEKRVAKKKAL